MPPIRHRHGHPAISSVAQAPLTVPTYQRATTTVSSTALMLYNASKHSKTIAAYQKASSKFLLWCRNNNININAMLSSHDASVDNTMSQYLSELYLYHHQRGSSGKTEAQHTVFGLLHSQPQLHKTQVQRSIAMLSGWNRIKPSTPHPPMRWIIAVAVAVTMLSNGHTAAAVATLLAWDCYLRVSELCNMKAMHVLMPSDPRNPADAVNTIHSPWRSGPRTIIAIPHNKSGTAQYVAVENEYIQTILSAYIQRHNKHHNDNLFPLSVSTYSKLFHRTVNALNMQHIPFTPHSLRHGGATEHFIQKGESSLEQIMFRGRWMSYKTMRRYIQASPAITSTYDMPQQIAVLGNKYKHHLLSTFLPHV